jgi:hypothetical protein
MIRLHQVNVQLVVCKDEVVRSTVTTTTRDLVASMWVVGSSVGVHHGHGEQIRGKSKNFMICDVQYTSNLDGTLVR